MSTQGHITDSPSDASVRWGGTQKSALQWNRVAQSALVLLLVFLPLALGSVPAWTVLPAALLAFIAWGGAWAAALADGRTLRLPWLAWVPAAGAGLCALQLVPLPPGLLDALSPPAAELRDFALVPLGLSAWRPISLDPSATWRELAKHLAYLGALAAAAQLARRQRVGHRLLGTVAVTGAALAAAGLVHTVLGAERLFGLWQFQYARPRVFTPFGNPNHLAGYLLLSSTLSLGFLLDAHRRWKRVAWLGAYGVSWVALAFSLSRAGLASAVVAQALVVAWTAGQRGRAAKPQAWRWAALGVGSGLVLAGFFAFDRLVARFTEVPAERLAQQSKVEFWPTMLEAARHFARTGMGRGAYELAYLRFPSGRPGKLFTHPENWAFQLASEWGVWAAAAFTALALGAGWRLWRASRRGPMEAAALSAAVGLGLHNLFDFNLEFPAVAASLFVALGVVSAEAIDGPRPALFRWKGLAPRRAAWALGGVGALSLLAVFAAWSGRHRPEDTERTLQALAGAAPSLPVLRAQALPLLARHPGDPFLYLYLGEAHLRRGAPQPALAFANRALLLDPHQQYPHLLAARALRRLGRATQAMGEYRLAAQSSAEPHALVAEAMAASGDARQALAAVPAVPGMYAYAAGQLRRLGRSADARALASLALEETARGSPERVELWRERIAYAETPEEALARVDEARGEFPADPSLTELHARALRDAGRLEDARSVLFQQLEQNPGSETLWLQAAQLLLQLKRVDEALALLARGAPHLSSTSARAARLDLEAQAHWAAREKQQALEAHLSAARIQPAPHRYYGAAQAYESMGRLEEALEVLQEGMRLEGDRVSAARRTWHRELRERRFRTR